MADYTPYIPAVGSTTYPTQISNFITISESFDTEIETARAGQSTLLDGINLKLNLAGGTMSGIIANFESTGIIDNATITRITVTDTNTTLAGNIIVGGTVDGRDIASDGTKLDTIKTSADITDTTTVTAAGALMDSEVNINIKTLTLPASTTISTFGASLIDDIDAAAARATLGSGTGDMLGSNNLSDVSSISTSRSNLGLGALATLNSVGAAQIDTGAVGSSEIATGAVDNAELATGAVTAIKIAAGTITATELATNSVTASEIDADAVGASEIATGAVGQAEIAANAVGQSEIKTTYQELSVGVGADTVTSTYFTPSGGIYIIGATFRASVINSSGLISFFNERSGVDTSNVSRWKFTGSDSGVGSFTAYGRLYYIQASPPYDLGDGEVGLFIFAIIDNATGKVESVSSATEAPWHYNGKTDVRGKLMKDGKKYRERKDMSAIPFSFNSAKGDPVKMAEYAAAFKAAPIMLEEITQEIKQADMIDIPHPFIGNDLTGKTVVMLDPVSDLNYELSEMAANYAEFSLNELLHNGDLIISNAGLNRSGPAGILIPSFTWR